MVTQRVRVQFTIDVEANSPRGSNYSGDRGRAARRHQQRNRRSVEFQDRQYCASERSCSGVIGRGPVPRERANGPEVVSEHRPCRGRNLQGESLSRVSSTAESRPPTTRPD
jgi:hypothetical protein